ncbi:unnamed protein product [Polarella glacialis]|uniref:Glutathione S-transferase n=1 Tax=Polarella glacialis TaxID=89957 RepID=A0A813LRX1_POLGL|nr:unnamed protein product [Polarella glacialis]CAE8736479.1 unnamed protein product [Polarella glacialis]|mmetsp:Transcript_29148/g.46791  ORF Transcript_29148/g.46791 Transcript_29148/m.46791 type:complete len:207 (+) Transcript_29148:89-709(+)|eukprot:CAMPEP_0115077338 /NCGR_PEP_ID=MMETSP0227-20121206/16938_1 /TAXON_ID=89957 /ORGANISM="Polarella glacialis, Strain CCMP 1383" /LENGTH=206 /DNA_ID=CAMNT_0002464601 /DNA_START=66 /DNA_END=686 /DNA_ORIENTATION=+
MAAYTLYSLEGSGNSLKARLMLDFLGQPFDAVAPQVHPADAAFLKLNPLGQVPVLVEAGGPTICDSAAILVYLVQKHAPGSHWFPIADPIVAANITKWVTYAGHEVTDSLLWVRIKNKFTWEIPVTYEDALERSIRVLKFLDTHLENFDWFAETAEPTIADVAIFPYVALAESSSSDVLQLSDYPAVQRWVARFKALPNCHPMPPF